MLYGRDAERAEIGALLEAARDSRSGVLILRGEPGIGKTALLEDTRQRAGDMHVLTARGVESESELPFAGLHQLLRPALPLLDRLPEPQAAALQGALGLAGRHGDDRFLISVACLTLLSELAERRPVLCLLDDAQWLDTPSADALVFVARRLEAEGIVMVFAARGTDAAGFEARDLVELSLQGLDEDAATSLIERRMGKAIAESTRNLLVEQAGGNALALVELPSGLSEAQLRGEEPLPESLPLTREIERVFLERVRRLPEPTQRLLLIVAADVSGRVAPVIRAAGALGIAADALANAEEAGVISVRAGNLELHHPLMRSAVYQSSSSSARRAAHLALADAPGNDEEVDQGAWHRAAASLGPDAAVAEELERTAMRAQLRSGPAAAAAALRRAAELSPDGPSSARRLVAAADAAWHAGQPGRAAQLLEQARPNVSDPRLRAEEEHLRGVMEFWCGSLPGAHTALLTAADAAAPADAGKALRMLFDAAEAAGWAGDFQGMAEVGRRAAVLPQTDDDDDAFLVDLLVGVGGLYEGKTAHELPSILNVIAEAEHVDEPRWLVWAASAAGVAGHKSTEAVLLRRAVTSARESGAVDALTHALVTVALRGLLDGRFEVAAEAAEGLTLAREAGLPNAASIHLAVLSWLASIRGQDEECRAAAAEVAEATRASGNGFAKAIADWAVALLELRNGRLDEAVTRLAAVSEARPGEGQPFIALVSAPDLVEACVRTRANENARQAFSLVDRFAESGAPAWALGLTARCRALLGAEADVEDEYAEAVRLHSEAKRPFDRARTELLFGEHLRRRRKRVESRGHLRAAWEIFEGLGAAPWAERARSELRASGETARKRDPSTIDQLTPQELHIARLVAEGLSNKEVAAQLFLSPRTIDYHLRNVFSKLEITSRTQLAHLSLANDEFASAPAPALTPSGMA